MAEGRAEAVLDMDAVARRQDVRRELSLDLDIGQRQAAPFGQAVAQGLGGISVVGHMMIVGAFRRTEASILAPFQYLEIISATVLGYLIFDDFPDALTWLGTAIILASGLYVFYREQKRGRVVAARSKVR